MNRNDVKRILTQKFLSVDDIKKMTDWLSEHEIVEVGIYSKVYHFHSSFIVFNENKSCAIDYITKHDLIGIIIDYDFKEWENWYNEFVYDIIFLNDQLVLKIWPYTPKTISKKVLIPKKFKIKNNRLIIDDYIEDLRGFI